MKTSSGLSRRKGSNSSRSGTSQYALLLVICVALILSLVVAVLYIQNSFRKDGSFSEKQNNALPLTVNSKVLEEEAAPIVKEAQMDHGRQNLVISTSLGDIRILLRPDYSTQSVRYIQDIVASGQCQRCSFYRAEKKGILQGIIKHETLDVPTQKGVCPSGMESVPNNCPPHDSSCGCHGPIMQRGYVAWAAGKTGPDFFVDDYRQKAEFWGTQHTVWGQIVDDNSFNVIDSIWGLPATPRGGLTYLDSPIRFTMKIEQLHEESG